ncbi:MAG: glucokinase, partial [Pseudobdellovibrionaceae bacterium]
LIDNSHCQKNHWATKAVLGPGTGLGVSGLIYKNKTWCALQGEGGNVALPITSDFQFEVYKILKKDFPDYVYAETVFSGQGLVRLANAMKNIYGWDFSVQSPAELTEKILNEDNYYAKLVMHEFIHWFSIMAGDLALTVGSTGGVYIGGGIFPRLCDVMHLWNWSYGFQNKGRYKKYLQNIPLYLIKDSVNAPLQGALALVRDI